jgi:hypothetical protein
MIRLTFAAMSLLAMATTAHGSQYAVAWSLNIANGAYIQGLSAGPQGGVTVAGSTYTSSFAPSAGSYDAFAASYDEAGNLNWAAQFGGSDWDEVQKVSVDSAGNAILGGRQSHDAFVAKYNAAGNLSWKKTFGAPNYYDDLTYGITTDAAGNAYAAGSTIGPNPFHSTAFFTKYDVDGHVLWSNAYVDTYSYYLNQDSTGNMYLYGRGPAPVQNGIYLVKVDQDGNELFQGQIATELPSTAIQVVANGLGELYLIGSVGSDFYLAKCDPAGNLLWWHEFGSTDTERARAMTLDAQGNIFVAGSTTGTFAGDNLGKTDALLLEFDPDGNLISSYQFGGPQHDLITAIALDPFGNVYVGGSQQILNQSNSTGNGWLVKLTPVPEPSSLLLSATALLALGACALQKGRTIPAGAKVE